MTEQYKNLDKAKIKIKEFESEKEPERLREAYIELENVDLTIEKDSSTRTQVRVGCIYLWMELIQLLDKYIDPAFDPKDVPEVIVQPPPGPSGEILRPGTDPASIKDPKIRAEYEKAIETNKEKAIKYRLQIQFGRLNESITASAKSFIRNSYNSSISDQAELKTAIEKIIIDPIRKEDLLKLLIIIPNR